MKGYVLPADLRWRGRVVEWTRPGDLLPLLYREIGCDRVDYGRAVYPDGEITIWVDDTALTKPGYPEYNYRALSLARAGGWNVEAIAGTVFITGGLDPEGETLGVPDQLLQHIKAVVQDSVEGGPL